ncbi:MAG: flippase activity-associated protein Agl23 [Methanoculleaceae archaeon]
MESAGLSRSLRDLFTFKRLFLIICILAFLLRFLFLDLKLFHHDEAVHAWFSWRLLTQGRYIYDPVYHGPFLYYVTAGMFGLFGSSDMVGRLVPALLGSLMVPLVYAIHRLGYLDRRQTLVAALFMAVSPEMVYFSRFLRNDIFVAFFTLLLLVACLAWIERRKLRYAVLAGLAAGCGMSCKENMPFVLVIFGGYLGSLLATRRAAISRRMVRDGAIAVVVMLGLMAVFYSSFGAHPEVLLTGWQKAIEHWTAMHRQQRLGGPWFFYIALFALYDLPIFLLGLSAIVLFIRGPRWTVAELVEDVRAQLAGTATVRQRNREFTRFCIVWFLVSVAIYAYLGEKVPWLILHQLLPLIFVAVYGLTTRRRVIIAAGGAVLLLLCTWHVAFVPADINEPIVQVQNSEDLREVMAAIDAAGKVVVTSESYWPLPWYYRNDTPGHITYSARWMDPEKIESGGYDLVIAHDTESYQGRLPDFVSGGYRLSYWFDYGKIQNRIIEYYFFRTGEPGSLNIDLFARNGTAAAAVIDADRIT